MVVVVIVFSQPMRSSMFVPVLAFFLFGLPYCLFNLPFLLLNQVGFHGVLFVVIPYEQGQLPLLGKHRLRFLLFAALVVRQLLAFFPHDVLPSDLELIRVIVVSSLVPRMVHADESASNVCAAEIVNSQVCAPLVLVLEPSETLRLAGLLVAGKL